MDTIDLYLKEISRYPLLERDEEIEEFIKFKNGSDVARERLIRSNLRFVVSIAKRYSNGNSSVLSDMINEGNKGLIRSLKKFDHTRGVKFISYASWWIRQAIIKYIAENGRSVRIPLNKSALISQYLKIREQLSQEQFSEPSVEDLAEEMEISVSEAVEIHRGLGSSVSLDGPVPYGDREGGTLRDVIPDKKSLGFEDKILGTWADAYVNGGLVKLTEREIKILNLYFGLNGEESLTLEEIGDIFGVTRERIRQIKEKAIGKLKRRARADKLLEMIN